MVHLLGSEDWRSASTFCGGASLSEAELDGATRVPADTVLTTHQGAQQNGAVLASDRALDCATAILPAPFRLPMPSPKVDDAIEIAPQIDILRNPAAYPTAVARRGGQDRALRAPVRA